MSITQALSNALTGLNVAKRGAEVASSNIANALTQGYGVRELQQHARDHGGMGAGVAISGLTRHVNAFVLSERRLADAEVGFHRPQADAAKQLERIFGVAGRGDGLMGSVAKLEETLIRAAGDPIDERRHQQAVQSLAGLTKEVRDGSAAISGMRERAEGNIAQMVEQLNGALEQIDRMNDDIVRMGYRGQPVAGLYDQRQKLIDDIAEIVPLKQLDRDGGRVALISAGGETLLDHRPRKIGFTPAGVIGPEMTVASGALGGLSIDGRPMPGGGMVGLLAGGRLAAEFQIRDDIAVSAHTKLDEFADSLMKRFQDPSIDPTMTAPGTGLVVPQSVAPGISGLASRVDVNPALISDPTKLRDGFDTTPLGAPGDPTVLKAWGAALRESIPYAAGQKATSLADMASDISVATSTERISFETQQSYAISKRDALKSSELADGVDSDKEMQQMMLLEQAYAANAKVISTVDAMMRHLMEI